MTEEERKERRREYNRRYYAAHKAEYAERSRKWKEKHRARALAMSRANSKKFRMAHPDRYEQYTITGYINYLKKRGYTITKDGVEV